MLFILDILYYNYTEFSGKNRRIRMRSKKIIFLAAAVIAAFALLAGCAGGPVPREAGKAYQLVVLHTNDHHGSIMALNSQGGLAERAAFVKSVRAEYPQVLLIDAGDINTGPVLSNMFNAEPDIKAYNAIGYDLAIFGNHEFDGTREKLLAQIKLADFPFLCANVKNPDGSYLGTPYITKDYEGFRVGLFGITTQRTIVTTSSGKEYKWINEIEAAREMVKTLKAKKADIIIAVTHIGDVKESEDHVNSPSLAEAVPGIDIIIDGHSHSYFTEPLVVNGAYIVTANEWGKYVGEGILTVVDGKLAGFDWKPVQINSKDAQTYAPDPEIAALLAPYQEKAGASLKEVIGQAAEDFVFGNRLTRYQETAIGDMILDSNVWYFNTVYGQNVDFALHNGGNIRAALPKGNITREQILTVLPFENYLYVVSLPGSKIQELFDFIANVPQGAGGFPVFSKEVRYTIDKAAGQDKGKVTGLTISGAPVDPAKTYRFCTNDFLLGGGDGYEILKQSGDKFNTSLLLSYVVEEYIRAQGGVITPATDGRLTVIGGTKP
jgi:5'-nucleotidase/UDP-sugar diphosphatase